MHKHILLEREVLLPHSEGSQLAIKKSLVLSGLDLVLFQLNLSLFPIFLQSTGITTSLWLINASGDSLGSDTAISALWLLCMCSSLWVMYSAMYRSVKAVLGNLTQI